MENVKPLITVIICVYNGSKYLQRCIRSVLNQTVKDLEIIIINDGSTDETPKICDELAKVDERIKVIHQSNSGLSHSRNVGIDNARGAFIGFVDSDDWISPKMYQVLLEGIVNNGADISSVKYQVTRNEMINDDFLSPHFEVLSGVEKLRRYLEVGISDRSNLFSACTKLYRKELFNAIRFPEGMHFEDVMTNYQLIGASSVFVVNNSKLYYYYTNSVSITRNKCSIKDLDLITISNDVYNLTKGTEIEYLGEILYCKSFFSILLKAVVYGVGPGLNEKEFICTLHESFCLYYRKLIFSPIPLKKKICMPFLRISPMMMRKAFRLINSFLGIVKGESS